MMSVFDGRVGRVESEDGKNGLLKNKRRPEEGGMGGEIRKSQEMPSNSCKETTEPGQQRRKTG